MYANHKPPFIFNKNRAFFAVQVNHSVLWDRVAVGG